MEEIVMVEIGRNLFYSLAAEVIVVVFAILLKDDKRKVVLVLVLGTLIAGLIGFWGGLPQVANPPSTDRRFTQDNVNAALGIGNWECFPNRIDGVSFLNVPPGYVVTDPIANVDKQGVKYDQGEAVPPGGNSTAWLDGQLSSRRECPP
jgi:hypothetical protein